MLIIIPIAAILILIAGASFLVLIISPSNRRVTTAAQYSLGICSGAFFSLAVGSAAYPLVRLQIEIVERFISLLGLGQLAGAWVRFMHGVGALAEVLAVGMIIGCITVWLFRKYTRSPER